MCVFTEKSHETQKPGYCKDADGKIISGGGKICKSDDERGGALQFRKNLLLIM